MEDTRQLKLFEKTLGDYEIAGAICSYGDVINFIDGEKKGIVLVDTCGHRESYGKKMNQFLKEEIEKGWGTTHNAKTEFFNLQKRMIYAGTGKEYFEEIDLYAIIENQTIEEQWWDHPETQYLQLNSDSIESIGSYFIHIKLSGDQEFGVGYNGLRGQNTYRISTMDKGDIMLISSDGLKGNIILSNWEEWKQFDRDGTYSKCKETIGKPLSENRLQDLNQIRDKFVDELSHQFLPQDFPKGKLTYDDVTFAIVKKIN